MAEMIKIKNGGVVTIVPERAFESIYKPKGWVRVDENVVNILAQPLEQKGIINEKQQNAYIKANREKSKRHFDDGLFKGE